jgi:hypothetical protein
MSFASRPPLHARADSSTLFPPESTRLSEVDAVMEFLRSVIRPKTAVYVSSPITSGRRFVQWAAVKGRPRASRGDDDRAAHNEHVIEPNRKSAQALVTRLRQNGQAPVIDPTAVGDVASWRQDDYRVAWGRVIHEFAHSVVFSEGWEFSNGCAYEYLIARNDGLRTLDHEERPLTESTAKQLLRSAIHELRTLDITVDFLEAVFERLSLATVSAPDGPEWLTATPRAYMKDAALSELANHGNVAQFVSFTPTLAQRCARIRGHAPDHEFDSTEAALCTLIRESTTRSVNVRTFDASLSKTLPFVYGIRSCEEAVACVKSFAADGLYTIVNETVDVNDGGVSGVCLANVLEFAPQDTPRCVEKPGAASMPKDVGLAILQRVYGFLPNLPDGRLRVEFSIHPVRAGIRHEHTILWEAAFDSNEAISSSITWPNRFSRFVGDKTFGLLVADAVGMLVPRTRVVGRNVAPFQFGKPTGTGEVWIRTAPAEAVPGKYSTHLGWRDPFRLLNEEDPKGDTVVAVLAQESVNADYSGASIETSEQFLVEGVRGVGQDFMLGTASPERIPKEIIDVVRDASRHLTTIIGRQLKLEWVFDGERLWIIQLQIVASRMPESVLVEGNAPRFHSFNAADGIEELRRLIDRIRDTSDGVEIVGDIGVTSHLGDLLRQAGLPARVRRPH